MSLYSGRDSLVCVRMNPPKKKQAAPPKQTDDSVQELERLKDMAARAQADLQNAKDRMQKEAVEMRRYALENTLLTLLPTIHNFRRAFDHLPEDLKDHEWVKGIGAIEQEFIRHLEAMGLTRIDALGEQVDSAKHDVLQTGPGEEGKITEVFEEGYQLNGKVLRPAKVRVGEGNSE